MKQNSSHICDCLSSCADAFLQGKEIHNQIKGEIGDTTWDNTDFWSYIDAVLSGSPKWI